MSRLFAGRAAAALLSSAVLIAPALAQNAAPTPGQPQQRRPQQRQPAQQRPAQQPQQQAAPAQPAPQPPQKVEGFASGWARICQPVQGSDVQACIVTQEVFAETGTFMASVAIQEPRGEQRRQLIAIVPLGVAIQSGILMRIDEQPALAAKIGTCLQNGCFAGLDLGTDVLGRMRQGTNMFITVRTAQGVVLDLTVPLGGLGAAADGAPTDQAGLQERQRRFQEQVTRRQEDTRRQIQQQQQQQQQQGGAPGAPAPGTAPAPAAPPAAPAAPAR